MTWLGTKRVLAVRRQSAGGVTVRTEGGWAGGYDAGARLGLGFGELAVETLDMYWDWKAKPTFQQER